jgi:hypothetical protein
MALIGLASAFMVVAVATIWLVVKAGTWQMQADYSESEQGTNAPRVVLDRGMTVFRTVIIGLLLSEFGVGLASWLIDTVDALLQYL